MLKQRIIVAIFLIPIGFAIIACGGLVYSLFIVAILGLAAWEFARLFSFADYKPASYLVIGGTILIGLSRHYGDAFIEGFFIAALIIAAMLHHLISYERGNDKAGTDFAITLGGIFYIGWIGAYFISLRSLPEGKWWVLIALPAVWFADTGAYFIGRKFGKRKLSPRLSPKKTWEGYLAGIIVGILGTILLTSLWMIGTGENTNITLLSGAIIGAVVATLAPVGDLGESMIKRQVGVKDSSNLIPGHGGAFDRIDSWLWAAVIGYYLIATFFL